MPSIPIFLGAVFLYSMYRLIAPKALRSKYEMVEGDNAQAIAARFGVTQMVLSNMNPGAKPGSTLALPNVKDLGARAGAKGIAS